LTQATAMAAIAEPQVTTHAEAGVLVVALAGAWTARTARRAEAALDAALRDTISANRVRFTGEEMAALDTVGSWLIIRRGRSLEAQGAEVAHQDFSPPHAALLDQIAATPMETAPPRAKIPLLLRPFDALGRAVAGTGSGLVEAQAVQGRILAAFGAILAFRGKMRVSAFVNQFEAIVYRAVPIVVLLSLVVGAIVTQQSILQLRNFGAAIFVVDLAAILMLREIGLLLAAIMVAGRSGSAITAELGSMRMREEIDALRVMGVDPYQALILPRVLALVLGLPLLAFLGAIAGLAGAAIVSQVYGGIGYEVFLDRLQGALSVQSLLVGLVKAPVMAFIIGLIATNEGFKVSGSSESLGRHTTASVVKSIFAVIVADGLFAVFFTLIGV